MSPKESCQAISAQREELFLVQDLFQVSLSLPQVGSQGLRIISAGCLSLIWKFSGSVRAEGCRGTHLRLQ